MSNLYNGNPYTYTCEDNLWIETVPDDFEYKDPVLPL